jgi:hypothetical protein
MNMDAAVISLGHEWEQPEGFFACLRAGVFQQQGFERTLKLLREILLDDQESLSREFVACVWFIPLFMTWQRERIAENGMNMHDYDQAFHALLHEVYRLLGTP